MHLDPWTFVLQIGNFLILVLILRRYVWRPVLELMAKRQAELAAERAAAEKAHAEAAAWEQTLAAKLAEIAAERDRVLDAARQQAAQERTRLLERGQTECEAALGSARDQIAKARADADAALRREAGTVAVDIASRLLALADGAEVDEPLFARTLSAIRAMPQPKRLELGAAARLVSARPPRDRGRWREQLAEAVGAPLDVIFETDPELLAGVEVHFKRTNLRFSWRDGLRAALEELMSDGHDLAASA